jgi:hypothetical protein
MKNYRDTDEYRQDLQDEAWMDRFHEAEATALDSEYPVDKAAPEAK